VAVVAGAVLLPLLGGAREGVGSTLPDTKAHVDGKLKNAATRGSTRR
jgi:hypothetical protein